MKQLCLLLIVFTSFALNAQLKPMRPCQLKPSVPEDKPDLPEFENQFSKYNYFKKPDYLLDSFYTLQNVDQTKENLMLDAKSISTFSANGLLDKKFFYFYDPLNQTWALSGRADFKFDANHKLISETSYTWDENTESYTPDVFYNYAYDNLNNEIYFAFKIWDAGLSQWVNYLKSESEFDNHNKRINKRTYGWDDNLKDWVNRGKYMYTYNAEGKLNATTELRWDVSNNTFRNYRQTKNIYEADTIEIASISKWLTNSNTWSLDEKFIYKYNQQGKIYFLLDSIYDTNAGSLIPLARSTYLYDLNGNDLVDYNYNWSTSLKDWHLDNERKYFWSLHELNTKNKEIQNDKPSLWSNLVKNNVRLVGLDAVKCISVVNLQGTTVFFISKPKTMEEISVSHWPSGIYIVRFENDQTIHTEKFIKN